MKIAIPIWQGRISPVLDVATRLLVVEQNARREVRRIEETLTPDSPLQRAKHISGLGVEVLICGGISQPLFSFITAQGISVIPWVTGQTEQVLDAYRKNLLQTQRFTMPGCGGYSRGRGCGSSRGKGRGRKQGRGGKS